MKLCVLSKVAQISQMRNAGPPESPLQRKLAPLKQFFREAQVFWDRCNKPSWVETQKVSIGIGAVVLTLGFMGFAIRLIHIPINHFLVGS